MADETFYNALGHYAYIKTDDDDPRRNAEGLRPIAPNESVDVKPGSVLEASAQDIDGIVPEAEYEELLEKGELGEASVGYEINPSDRPAIVDSAMEAVAVGNASLAPAGGLQDGPPPRGDAPGAGFEGAIGLAAVGTDVEIEGLDPHTAVTGASPADQKPKAATDPASTTPGAEDPADLVAEESRGVEGDAAVEKAHGKRGGKK